ncbi:HNH endonuclease [Microbacterium enclense]|uniref:HNH endonuclease n=1 Tax=Microbacterium enclense TaxID=993073 RepID=A0A443JKZ4_9MICO|nr:HNH endonuclease signature motif containing protein [Microbacterium enclense]RWR21307.1 HNH endonuclease [Microbacterium enclense]
MEFPAPPSERSHSTDAWSGMPRPGDGVLQSDADTAWAIALGLLDDDDPETDSGCASSHGPAALLDRLEESCAARHRVTAAEYDLIFRILQDAADDPDTWVGPDPTLDGLWHDPRGRTIAAVRRDRLDLAERAAVAEIAVRLRLAEQTVRTRGAQAAVLRERCARIWAAFTEGLVSERHAVETARLAATLPTEPASWEAFDTGAIERALRLSPARFATSARALRERVHAESLETRHCRARTDRGVWMTAELDGMATLTAFLPADRAAAAMNHLDRTARHLATAEGDDRTLAQLRADVFADLLVGAGQPSDAAADAPPATVDAAGQDSPQLATPRPTLRAAGTPTAPARPSVVVTIPALTLLDADDAPATLDGYGPIDLDTARRLAGEAPSWIRVLTHPVTGVPLALDRTTYRVPAALRRWLGISSPTCAFPGCGRPARDCDLDHLHAFSDGGTTADDNLDPECRHHHRMRHETRWAASRDPDTGDLAWTTPLGARIDADPPPF